MSRMNPDEELLALCARATEGEWEHSGECSVREKATGHLIATTVNSDDPRRAADAAFIAKASPAVVRRLLHRIEVLTQTLEVERDLRRSR